METKFNFNSQVCTDKNQSERLIALGLKKETADMHYSTDHRGNVRQLWLLAYGDLHEDVQVHSLPAWSLHRLIELVPEYFANTKLPFRVEAVKWLAEQEGNVYDNLIVLVADCIKNGILNKEYLV